MGRSRNLVSIVEAAYAIGDTEEAWLDRLASAAEPDLARGFGTVAYLYDASSDPLRVLSAVTRSPQFSVEMVSVMASSGNDAYVEATWRSISFGAASSGEGFSEIPAVRDYMAPLGIHDVLALNAFDPSGVGVWVGAPQPKRTIVSSTETRTWSRVAAHLATAFRLRRAPRAPAAAVVSPSGSIKHAEGAAKETAARANLRDAVVAMDRARGPLRRRDPEGALGLWKGLVQAQWSLVDRFESDGKRYVVAVENEPTSRGPEVLAPRERQVVALAALGHSNKLIAYELGLGDSTVRVLLTRAARKVDVATRAELIALYRAHAASTTAPRR
jgi:DNA-binding CsgD family transcriptional regulator